MAGEGNLPNIVPIGRDHLQLIEGCPNCSDFGSGDPNYDDKFSEIASGLRSFLPTVSTNTWKQISPGWNHTCGIANNDQAYCWGVEYNGQLGNGAYNDETNTPVQVIKPIGVTSWKQISSGSDNTCGIANNDQAYCWGDGYSGQLGNGAYNTTNTPVQVIKPISVTSWKQISPGGYHTCGIANNDQAYCWGGGYSGQLGNGAYNETSTPVQVIKPIGVTSWKQISPDGWSHTCGIANNDQAYCWGYGFYGKLGNGANNGSHTPVQVVKPIGVTSWKQISSGGGHTCGIANNDRAYCWGYGFEGQLGNGTNNNYNTPVQVMKPTVVASWKQISLLGSYGTCGIANNDRAYCWGYGESGELGNGANNNYNIPVQVIKPIGVTSWKQISPGGGGHTCGIANNDQAYCWGYGGSGELGNGANDNHNTPVLVKDP